ncbi:Na+/H+-dicarboxylate symporter [Desulfonispora thiosulfatigenes DSM 11270]|uniref:Na+/H+-dicarboxylate symporter n=1 Tax=Desulfonispora thiosulfatigenes DSM 11270 TaxID=656914 RepID=A0A1W1UJU5_DESTI|nr:dicarboxylate/amino acid:cation symporter [Desulfonispora thiosulfatigenes]SMB81388.1 Na+/H+-dicarboxylate symporter [Desulfonispora thiosulfatigenes DSM 11270]
MKKLNISTKIFIGLFLGVLVGLAIPENITSTFIAPLGLLFLRLIKMIIAPLVFATLVMGASSVGDIKKLGRMGGKTFIYYMATTAVAIVIGLTLANIIEPGTGLKLAVDAKFESQEIVPIIDVFLNIIPENPLKSLVEGNMLQIIFFALCVGISLTVIGEKGKVVKSFFDGFSEVMFKITDFVMSLAPYGVFGLIAPIVAQYGYDVLKPLFWVILTVYLGSIIHAIFVYSMVVKVSAKISPLAFFKAILPAQLVGFSTCSSSGTLPASMQCAEENLGVSNEVSSFVLPLGATINMDGTCLYLGVCALFIAQVYGVDLSLTQQFTIVLTGTLASIGTAGVPGAGVVMLTMVLTSVGLPLDGIALIAGIDRILDMARTTLNITGDISAAVLVGATENEINYNKEPLNV